MDLAFFQVRVTFFLAEDFALKFVARFTTTGFGVAAGFGVAVTIGVAVGSGVFMRKFSFGDEEKIRTGKKLIKGSLFSYAFILGIDLILSAIKSLIN